MSEYPRVATRLLIEDLAMAKGTLVFLRADSWVMRAAECVRRREFGREWQITIVLQCCWLAADWTVTLVVRRVSRARHFGTLCISPAFRLFNCLPSPNLPPHGPYNRSDSTYVATAKRCSRPDSLASSLFQRKISFHRTLATWNLFIVLCNDPHPLTGR